MRSTMHVQPIVRQALQARDLVADFVVEYLRPATGNRIQTCIAQPRNRIPNAEFAVFRNRDNFRRRVAVQVNPGEPLLDAAQHLLMPVDFQVRMQAALHQHSRPTHLDGLTNLLVNGFEVEDVSLFCLCPFQRTIESTERTVLGAVVRVVNIPIDDVSSHAFWMELAAYRVSFHADTNQVIGTKQIESLLLSQGHGRVRNARMIVAEPRNLLQTGSGRLLCVPLCPLWLMPLNALPQRTQRYTKETKEQNSCGAESLLVAKILDQRKNSSHDRQADQYG